MIIETINNQLDLSKLKGLLEIEEDNESSRIIHEEIVNTHIKDLLILYFVNSLTTYSFELAKERVKVDENGAFQLAQDIDYMLIKVYQSEIIDQDEIYEDKLKQLKEIERWKRYLGLFFSDKSRSQKMMNIETEIGDLKYLRTKTQSKPRIPFIKIKDSFKMLDLF